MIKIKNKITRVEDIFPLTIVHMKHGKFAIVEANCDSYCVKSLQQNEEIQYEPQEYMNTEWNYINYGIGKDISEAFIDFKLNYKD